MVDHFLRQPKERLLAPVARRLGTRIHPTSLTLAAFSLGLAAALCAWRGALAPALLLWLLNRLVDGLDGTLARATDRQSDWGGYLDIQLDVVIYALLPLALVLGRQSTAASASLWVALSCLLASFYVNAISWSYLAALLEKRNAGARSRAEMTSVAMPAGLVEGTETLLFFCAFLLFPAALVPLFGTMAALVAVNIGQRLLWAARALGGQR